MRLSFWRSRAAAADPANAVDREPAPMAAALVREPPTDFVRLVFLGDISCGGGRHAPDIDPEIVGALQSADLVIANCASPVVRRPHLPVRSWLGGRRHMDAGSLLGIISAMGVETERLALSVANRRMFDQSPSGFAETVDTLRRLRVQVIGASRRAAVQCARVGSLKVGLLAFSDSVGRARRLRERMPTPDDFSDAAWRSDGEDRPDIVCAFPHWDRETSSGPSLDTQHWAARLVEKGVHLVAGHRPLLVHPIERIAHAYVAYGLGVFCGAAPQGSIARRVGAMLFVDVNSSPALRGRIAAYEMFLFARLPEGRRDRIVPLDTAPRDIQHEAAAALSHLGHRLR